MVLGKLQILHNWFGIGFKNYANISTRLYQRF